MKIEIKYTNTLAKRIIILIPIIILVYILSINFLIPQEFNYFYDIGSEQDTDYLTPDYRITEKLTENGITYREAIGHILYYEAELPMNSKEIKVEVKLKDNLPENAEIILGARDQQEWDYVKHYIQDDKNYLEDGWFIIETTFDIKEENIYTNNKKISLILWMQHLANDETKDYTIPIDYINITIYKPSIFEK